MADPLKATIQRVTQDTTVSATGAVVYLMRVQFMVGDHGPFQITLPADGFTADAARAGMQATADQINALTTS
jgi:hypothetical protein